MRVQLNALWALLRQALARTGWRARQSGPGTQIGQVNGHVTIQYQQPISGTVGDLPQRAPAFGQLVQVYKHELTPAERKGTDKFMRREFGTTTLGNLSSGDQVRLWAYMQTCLRNRANAQRIKPGRRI